MKPLILTAPLEQATPIKNKWFAFPLSFLTGLLAPLGFAPFERPGMTILGLALFLSILLKNSRKDSFYLGFCFGLGYFGLGVSWVIISVHDYGGLNYPFAGLITASFIGYLALFPALLSYLFKRLLRFATSPWLSMLLFSSLWCFAEILRSKLLTGFPWLLLGTIQTNTPLKHLAPIIGLSGLSFLSCFAASLLSYAYQERGKRRYYFIALFALLFILPNFAGSIHWVQEKKESISIGVIQANLSMREKWDEQLFWRLLKYYKKASDKLLGKQLIILPESAIPLPASYLNDYLEQLDKKARQAKTGLLIGLLQASDETERNYYNSIISLGNAHGEYLKQHLVPFGEYIPSPFVAINHWLNLPEPNIVPAEKKYPLIHVGTHPIASLICYEIAYPSLLRQQMPQAEWIVSVSDNGWFGHSFASYQQLQMAQMLSLMSGRYQIIVNNDGLSSVINPKGEIVEGLPAFSAGILEGEIYPAEGITPWIRFGDYPLILCCSFVLLLILYHAFKAETIAGKRKRGYP